MSKAHLWIEYKALGDWLPKGLSLVFPAVEANLPVLDILFERVQTAWQTYHQNTFLLLESADWAVIGAIAQLLPTAPGLGWHLNWLREDSYLVEQLFLSTSDREADLLRLHRVAATPRAEWQQGDPITIADVPFPSCGDRHADALALQFYHFGMPNGWEVHQTLDLQTRCGVQKVLAELNRDPDERINEYLKEIYEYNLQLDPTLADPGW